jgi:hypothetical protein
MTASTASICSWNDRNGQNLAPERSSSTPPLNSPPRGATIALGLPVALRVFAVLAPTSEVQRIALRG